MIFIDRSLASILLWCPFRPIRVELKGTPLWGADDNKSNYSIVEREINLIRQKENKTRHIESNAMWWDTTRYESIELNLRNSFVDRPGLDWTLDSELAKCNEARQVEEGSHWCKLKLQILFANRKSWEWVKRIFFVGIWAFDTPILVLPQVNALSPIFKLWASTSLPEESTQLSATIINKQKKIELWNDFVHMFTFELDKKGYSVKFNWKNENGNVDKNGKLFVP